jgi:putative oxidoreductase
MMLSSNKWRFLMTDWLQFLARFLISQIFLGAGILKLLNSVAITQQIATRVSGPLIPLFLIGAIAAELLGGVALLVGFRTNWAATLLAAYVLIATSLYHTNFSQAFQADMLSKDVAIIGGLVLVAAFGAGRISLDTVLGR